MSCWYYSAWSVGNPATVSHHDELPPTSTIAQLSLVDYYEFAGQAHVDLGFTRVEFLDGGGVPRHDDFLSIDDFDSTKLVARNRMIRADYSMQVANCSASYLINYFFWPSIH